MVCRFVWLCGSLSLCVGAWLFVCVCSCELAWLLCAALVSGWVFWLFVGSLLVSVSV